MIVIRKKKQLRTQPEKSQYLSQLPAKTSLNRLIPSLMPYFKSEDWNEFNNNSNLSGDKNLDNRHCLVVKDKNPKILAEIIIFLYSEKLKLTLENCVEVYRIIDFLELKKYRENEKLVDFVLVLEEFIKINLLKLSKENF